MLAALRHRRLLRSTPSSAASSTAACLRSLWPLSSSRQPLSLVASVASALAVPVACMARRSLCSRPDLDPAVPSPDRVLEATRRETLGSKSAQKLRTSGRVPASLLGDRLPFEHLSVDRIELMNFLRRPHFQRELLTLAVEGGETVRVLPQEVQYDTLQNFLVRHVNFRRWPRDPVRHPVKLAVPIIFTHEDSHPKVKQGSYVYEVFADTGLRCLVRDAAHVPRFLVGDMRRSVNGDLRFNHLDMPPGVTVRPHPRTLLDGGNFLVGRVKKTRG